MSVSITGTSSNVQINNADLHVTNASKKVIAPRAELLGINGIALTTESNVGMVNTAPIHTLDVGSKFSVDETGDTTVRVRGLLEADTIKFGGSTADRVFVSDATGALSTDEGLQYNSSTQVLTLVGALDANSTADIADTLTLSKASGTGLSVNADASVGGTFGVTGATTLTGALDANSTADIADTLSLSKVSGTGLAVTADATVGGTMGVTGAATLSSTLGVTGVTTLTGALDANSTADIADTLTLSKASGTGLSVIADATVGGTFGVTGATTLTGALDANSTADIADTLTLSKASGTGLSVNADASVGGTMGVAGAVTLSSTLGVTGTTTLTGALDANSTADIADTLTLSKGSGTGLSVNADASVGGTLGVTGTSTLAGVSATTLSTSGLATLNSTSITNNATVGGTLGVTGATTLSSTLNSGAATLASASITGAATVGSTLGVTGASTLTSASITGSGNALNVTNNAVISGQMRASSGLIDNNLQVNGNLIVDGELTVIQTNNLVVEDPLIELGNANTNGGAILDVGMVFRQPPGTSNVATFYDASDEKYRIALTNNGAYDNSITPTGAIEVEISGNVTASTITADVISLNGSNIRIEGNSIVFG